MTTTPKNTDSQLNAVGRRPVRHDGYDKVTGKALYGADMNLPGMLYGRILRSPHAHARIISIDISKAQAHPDVNAVITNADFPQHKNESSTPIPGPALNAKEQTENILASEKVLYKGHPIAAVAAATVHAAEEALSLIKIQYEILGSVSTVEEAIAPDAPQLHSQYKGNVASHTQL